VHEGCISLWDIESVTVWRSIRNAGSAHTDCTSGLRRIRGGHGAAQQQGGPAPSSRRSRISRRRATTCGQRVIQAGGRPDVSLHEAAVAVPGPAGRCRRSCTRAVPCMWPAVALLLALNRQHMLARSHARSHACRWAVYARGPVTIRREKAHPDAAPLIVVTTGTGNGVLAERLVKGISARLGERGTKVRRRRRRLWWLWLLWLAWPSALRPAPTHGQCARCSHSEPSP
jgi:hypothetical protein